jgi:hypothetical protein
MAVNPRLSMPDERVLRSIAALKLGAGAKEFDVVVSALRRERDHYASLCLQLGDQVNLFRAQGAATLLNSILKVIEEAGK